MYVVLDVLTKLKPFLTEKQYHAYHRFYLASDGKPRLRRNVELALHAGGHAVPGGGVL